ncbi:MAG: xanthine dehydrogenase family protein subunit M, partial [Alphaproteobacteria bacterium]|nr:xanthine dehydrogenase family protein subunit M [Alphaproteobacteria bacterium]
LAGSGGTRSLPINDFLLDRGRTDRRDDEVLTAVRFSKPPDASATAFLKGGRRKAMEISVVCVAAYLAANGKGYTKARIAIGAAASRTFRAVAAEQLVTDGGSFAEAGRLASEAAAPIDDVRASARYRRLLVAALVERALMRCRERLP